MRIFLTGCFFVIYLKLLALGVSVHTYNYYADTKPYVDVNIRILANTIKYQTNPNKSITSTALVTMTIANQSDNAIIGWEKYKLTSPELEEKKDVVDQRRFALAPGNYILKMNIVDGLDTSNNFGIIKKIFVEELKLPSFSDVALITSLEKKENGPMVKNGIYMESFPFSIVNESQQNLHFYTEFYHKESSLISYGIYSGIEPSDSSKAVYLKYKKLPKEDVSALLHTFDLNKLPSGDYYLKVALIDENKKEITSKYASFINKNFPADVAMKRDFNKEFSNSFVNNLDSNTVVYSLKALAPQLNNTRGSALVLAIQEGTLNVQKYFLYNHWKSAYPNASQQAYETYMKVVKAVDEKFYSTVGHGFQTDRGYIYLKYGRPSKVINIEDEANTPPYEIWYYDHIERSNQNNVRFIYYSPLLANEFDLLHSTCQGEKQNTQWEVTLYKNAPYEKVGGSFEATKMQDNWNRKARKLFEDQ